LKEPLLKLRKVSKELQYIVIKRTEGPGNKDQNTKYRSKIEKIKISLNIYFFKKVL